MSEELNEIAPAVAQLPISIANVYFVGAPGSPWVLVDTGTPGNARKIRREAEKRFGKGSKPECILLTHGHFDHAGNAPDLVALWGCPVYAHTLEFPYLTGASSYPPADPTAPGFMAFMSRFFTTKPIDLGGSLRPLEVGTVPGLPDWEWHPTPGHAPGHVSFFRRSDATLLAGDAFTTVDLDDAFSTLAKKQQVSRPPTPFTYDWAAARASVQRMDSLKPRTIGCGHGTPMSGPEATNQLARLAYQFYLPSHGRYVNEPARISEGGVDYLPPAPADRTPGVAGAAGIAALGGVMFALAARKRRSAFTSA